MKFISSLAPIGGKKFSRFKCEKCRYIDYQKIPWNAGSDTTIPCSKCEKTKEKREK